MEGTGEAKAGTGAFSLPVTFPPASASRWKARPVPKN